MESLFSARLAEIRDSNAAIASRPAGAPSDTELRELLCRPRLGLEDLHALTYVTSEQMEAVAAEASRRRSAIWGPAAYVVTPLYVSDHCIDDCVYCEYRRSNRDVERRRLSPADIARHVAHLRHLGYRDIELVSGTDPKVTGAAGLEGLRGARSEAPGTLGVNFAPAEVSDYAAMKACGVDFVVLWQETYDPAVYRRVHEGSPLKSDMAYRLDAFDRMLMADVRRYCMAFLGGLADWRADMLSMVAHARYLHERYGAEPFVIGTPRRKRVAHEARGDWSAGVDDDEWRLYVCLLSLVFPRTLIWLSTRESLDLSLRAAFGGGAVFTLDCSTVVGGYLDRDRPLAQFPVHSYSLTEGLEAIRKAGLCMAGSLSEVLDDR